MKEVKLPSRSSGIHAFSSIFHSPKVLLFKYLSFFVQKKKKERNLALYDYISWYRYWLILVKGVNYKLISLILKNKLDGSTNFKNFSTPKT